MNLFYFANNKLTREKKGIYYINREPNTLIRYKTKNSFKLGKEEKMNKCKRGVHLDILEKFSSFQKMEQSPPK